VRPARIRKVTETLFGSSAEIEYNNAGDGARAADRATRECEKEREREREGEMKRDGCLAAERDGDGRSESRDPTLPVGRETSGFNSDEERERVIPLFPVYAFVLHPFPPVPHPINH